MSIQEIAQVFRNIRLANVPTMYVGDIYDYLNSQDSKSYSVACLEFIQAIETGTNTVTISARLSCIDRLLLDNSNYLTILDEQTANFHDIILALNAAGIGARRAYTLNYIKQDFTDHCAGVYANIDIVVSGYACDHQIETNS